MMKNIFILIILFILFSCGSHKNLDIKIKESAKTDRIDDFGKSDSLVNNDEILNVNSETEVSGSLPDFINTSNYKSNLLPKRSKIVNGNTKILVSDYVGDTKVKKSNGLLAYTIPDFMKVDESFTFKVRISKNESKQSIVLGSRGITIYDGDVNSNVNIELIDIKPSMSAKLLGDESSFNIVSLSSDYQDVDSNDYTEWEWRVTPLKSGKNYLKLQIRVKNSDYSYKDITIFEKNIMVKPNIKYSVNGWFSNNWQFLFSTLLIPIFTWWWSNRRKKKRSK